MIEAVLLLIAVCVLTAVGQTGLKLYAGSIELRSGLPALLRSLFGGPIIPAALCAFSAPFLYYKALEGVELGFAFAFTGGVGNILVLLSSVFVLREKVHFCGIAGVLLIITGILIWNL